MTDSREKKFSELIDAVAKELVATEHDTTGSFIRTPLTYPSGALVVVRVHRADDKRFFVSDWGLGYQEADLTGSAAFYTRHANPIAQKAALGSTINPFSSWRLCESTCWRDRYNRKLLSRSNHPRC